MGSERQGIWFWCIYEASNKYEDKYQFIVMLSIFGIAVGEDQKIILHLGLGFL